MSALANNSAGDRPEPDYKALWLDHLQQAAEAQQKFQNDFVRPAYFGSSSSNPYDFTAIPPTPEPDSR